MAVAVISKTGQRLMPTVTVRKQHYLFQPNDIVLWKGTMHIVKGTHCNGTRVLLETRKSVKLADLQIIKRQGGYVAPPTA